jgi:hypothetical protein
MVWARPVLVWGLFGFLVSAATFAFCSLFYRQWADRERLIFPITYLPVELTAAPTGSRRVNAFLSNPLVWIGAAIPIIVCGVNGLRTYFPGVPAIPTQWSPGAVFPDRPWSEFQIEMLRVYFSIAGVTFLLTTEVSFSLWFFFILYRLSFVYVAWLGAAATGYWGNWFRQVSVFQCAGAVLVVAGFLFWAARAALRAWLGRVAKGRDDPADLLPARLTFVLLAGGFLGMVGWFMAAGASWWAALGGIVLFVAILLVLTRIVAEAGMLYVGMTGVPYDVLTGVVPPGLLTGKTLAAFAMQKGVFMHDLREILLPYLMNGVRACDTIRMNLRKVLAVLALTALVAFAAAVYGRITTAYKYGGAAGDDWANLWSQVTFLGDLADFQKNPPDYDWVRPGGVRILPVAAAHLGTGALLAGGMIFMRSRFLWWPLNPFGFILCGTWEMAQVWFSVFLGWACKSAVMTFGGAATYRKWLPFFLGLVLGEAMIATVWVITSLITGQPGFYILPD